MTTTRKVDRRERDIKKKLSAAIIMLLLSCIMVVTSTYAWFTLSTAPEITGISTTIGANGNLEIALGNNSTWANPDSITSAEGDSLVLSTSNKSLKERNATWGNLVDLGYKDVTSGKNIYGLDQIVLYPSALNVTDDDKVSTNSILKTPEYGTDGRITKLDENVVTATYDEEQGKFLSSTGRQYGVSALGSVSGMSDRELSYNKALAQIIVYKNKAAQAVRSSWTTYGDYLASVGIKYVASGETAKITEEEFTNLDSLVNALDETMAHIDDALIYALDGYLASKATTWDSESAFLTFETALLNSSLIHNDVSNKIFDDVDDPTQITICGQTVTDSKIVNLVKEFNDMVTNVEAAKSEMEEAGKGFESATEIELSTVKDALGYLVDFAKVKVNGFTPAEAKDNLVTLLNQGVQIQLDDGSGIYFDIASFVGRLSSNVNVPEGTSYNGIGIGGISVNISTVGEPSPVKLDTMSNAIVAAGKPTNDATGGESTALTDTYGYIIDFFLRTNASNSNLLLSEAANRVSTDAEGVMGSGSNMVFENQASDTFSSVNVIKLMQAIRVVFIDEENNIVAQARLDASTVTNPTPDEYKMDLKIWDSNNGAFATNQVIIENMDVNTPIKLSTIVYLDGESVDNSMVANAAQSLSGSLNLQFASSAELTPMNYTDFVKPDENTTTGGTGSDDEDQTGSGDEGNN